MLILIVLLAAFLRLTHFSKYFYLGAEVGQNYLSVQDAFVHHYIPLLGPPTSHPWLSFGPLFYWVMAPVFIFTGFNPLAATALLVWLLLIVLFENYFFIRYFFGKKTALITTLLIAISPIWIDFGRGARFFSFVLPFFYPFIYFLSRRQAFLAGIFLGLMLNFHYSPLILLPVSLIYLPHKWIKLFLGIVLTQIPFLIYNLTHGFNMLAKFLIWLPYRATGLSTASTSQSPFTPSQFLTRSFSNFPLTLVLLLMLCSLFQVRKNKIVRLLWITLSTGLIGIALHRNPPIHYFLPLLPLPILLVGLTLTRLPKILTSIALTWSLLFMPFPFPATGPTYSDQLSLSKSIIFVASGRPYTLSRIGLFDNYPGESAESFRYLLGWLGNSPVDSAPLHITIHEVNKQLYFTQEETNQTSP